MKWNDIITLVKAGYSVADIKELKAMAEEPEPIGADPEETPVDEPIDTSGEPSENAKTDDIDYKALYEQEKQKLQKVQDANVRKPSEQPTEKTSDEIIGAFVRQFM